MQGNIWFMSSLHKPRGRGPARNECYVTCHRTGANKPVANHNHLLGTAEFWLELRKVEALLLLVLNTMIICWQIPDRFLQQQQELGGMIVPVPSVQHAIIKVDSNQQTLGVVMGTITVTLHGWWLHQADENSNCVKPQYALTYHHTCTAATKWARHQIPKSGGMLRHYRPQTAYPQSMPWESLSSPLNLWPRICSMTKWIIKDHVHGHIRVRRSRWLSAHLTKNPMLQYDVDGKTFYAATCCWRHATAEQSKATISKAT